MYIMKSKQNWFGFCFLSLSTLDVHLLVGKVFEKKLDAARLSH